MNPSFRAELDCSLMQFNRPTSTKTENTKYDNSTLKKINRLVASAARRRPHRARASHPCEANGVAAASTQCRAGIRTTLQGSERDVDAYWQPHHRTRVSHGNL